MKTDLKRRALHRIRIIQGQLAGLEKQVNSEQYCMDILTQSLAIQKSIGSLNKLIVENHISTHIIEGLSSGDEDQIESSTGELLQLYELHNRRGRS